MATRSTITAKFRDGKTYSIYVHWDGYIDTAGRTLFKDYQCQDKIEELLNLGNLSELGEHIGEKLPMGQRDPGACVACGRDKGENGNEKKEIAEDSVFLFDKDLQEYNYYWDGAKWHCREIDGSELTEENTK